MGRAWIQAAGLSRHFWMRTWWMQPIIGVKHREPCR